MKQHPRMRLFVVGALVAGLSATIGCHGGTTMSSAARPGDTVMVAFGATSFDPPGTNHMLEASDLWAEITDAGQSTRTARLRQVVHIYPDPASPIAAEAGGLVNLAGERTAVVDLVGANGVALALAPGTATLTIRRVGTNAVVTTTQVRILSTAVDGVGTPNPLHLFAAAGTARRQVRFRVNPTSPSYDQLLAGLEFELRFSTSVLNGVPETSWPQAVQTMQDANAQFTTRYYQDGADQVIKVMIVNPDGIKRFYGTPIPAATFYRGVSLYDTLAFSVVWGDSTLQVTYPTPTIARDVVANAQTGFRVFDVNGNDVSAHFAVVVD